MHAPHSGTHAPHSGTQALVTQPERHWPPFLYPRFRQPGHASDSRGTHTVVPSTSWLLPLLLRQPQPPLPPPYQPRLSHDTEVAQLRPHSRSLVPHAARPEWASFTEISPAAAPAQHLAWRHKDTEETPDVAVSRSLPRDDSVSSPGL